MVLARTRPQPFSSCVSRGGADHVCVQDVLEHLLLATLQQSEHVMVLVTSSYISSSWRQHGWYVVELPALPLPVAVQILQHAVRDAGQKHTLGARKGKELCSTMCKHLDPVIIRSMGYIIGAGFASPEVLPWGLGLG